MLKVFAHPSRDTLTFTFDTPIPANLAAHPGLSFVRDGLIPAAREVRRTQDLALSGLTLGREGWLELARSTGLAPELAAHEPILAALFSDDNTPVGDDLDVNFHQHSFDTPQRSWEFVLAQGHFPAYFFNRLHWYAAPKYGLATPYPLHADLETASTCNMNCPMCYRDQLNSTGQMDFDLFCRAVDECAAAGLFSLRLSWRGEALTHPRIKEMIAYAAARIRNVSFLTNAFYLEDDILDCLIENQVSYIAVSFDGIGEVYEAIRKPARYAENRGRLARLMEKRRAAGSLLPQVRVCTIHPAVSRDPQAYTEAMRPVSDYMVKNPYINFKGPMTIKPGFICQYPWERIVVAFDGAAQCCTGWNADDIVLGNIAEQSIAALWHSPLMDRVRRTHAAGRRMDLHSCAACRHGATGDPDIAISDILERRY